MAPLLDVRSTQDDEPLSGKLEVVTQVSKHRQAEVLQQKSVLQALSQGLALPGVPKFTDIERQRRFNLEHLAGAFRVLARKGFSEGMSGHISLRDPEDPHTFWTNPLGRHFAMLTAGDMILVNEAGVAVGGNTSRPANAAGFLIHGAVHRARPDVHAAAHFHTRYGKAWAAFGLPLEMLNQDVAMFYGDAQAVYQDFGGVVLETEEAERLAAALGPKGKAVILQNHGLLTVGGTVDEAAYLFCNLERSCEVQLLAEAAAANGIPKKVMRDQAARFTFEMTSDPESLYCEFQPDFELEDKLCSGEFRDF